MVQPPTLYRRVLGDRHQQLHPLLQEFHDRAGKGDGVFRIIRPPHRFKRILGALLGMPAAAENVPTSLTVAVFDNGSEKWVRSFGKFRMATWQWSWQGLLMERSGPVTFGIHVEIIDGGTRLITRRVWLLGIPIPLFLAPSVLAIETPVPGGWHAKVQLSFPLIGEMLGYEGEIYPNKSTPHAPREGS